MADLTDRDALLALMYDHDPEPEVEERKGPAPANPIMNMATISHKMYRMEKTIDEQDRYIKRLQQRVRNLERGNSQVTRSINDMGRELDQKIDKRGDCPWARASS